MQPIRIRNRFLLRTLTAAAPVALVLAAAAPLIADTINGDDNANEDLIGTAGDDTINGLGGDDIIYARAGNDTVDGGTGNDEIHLEAGDDVAGGREGNDTIYAGDGEDTVSGGPGNDTIRGNRDNDTLYGEEGDDDISGGFHEDIIDGGGGNDRLESGSGGGVIHGGAGNDHITLTGDSWGPPHLGYPKWDDPDFEFQRVVAEAYGDDGDDYIKSSPAIAGWGASFQFIHAGTGQDIVEGGQGQDLLIVQGNDGDTVITGPYEDYIAIIGNSVEGITFYDTLHYLPDGSVEMDENGKPVDYNNGTDMLCFVRDVNPDQLTMVSVWLSGGTKHFMEYDTGLPTRDAVNLDLNEHPMLKNIEAYRTGDGNDTLVSTDYGDPNGPETTPSYLGRLRGEQPAVTLYGHDPDNMAWLNLHHLFFTGAGNDTITTNRGNDLVDAGSGNDTIHVGPDNCFIITGPGRDTVRFAADSLDGTDSPNPDGGKTRISDLASGDVVLLEGVQQNQVTLEEQTMPDNRGGGLAGITFTSVKVDGEEQFVILALSPNQLTVANQGANAQITVRGRVTDPSTPLGPVLEGPRDRAENGGRAPAGADREQLPQPGNDRGGR